MGTTQRAVAEAADISEPHMSQVVNGRRQYTQELLEKVAGALGPGIEPGMLLYPPPSKRMWEIWQKLTPEQQEQAADMAAILHKKS